LKVWLLTYKGERLVLPDGAPCAGSGHFVAGIPLRVVLPMVAREIMLRNDGGRKKNVWE
jgi:hypothetical protein